MLRATLPPFADFRAFRCRARRRVIRRHIAPYRCFSMLLLPHTRCCRCLFFAAAADIAVAAHYASYDMLPIAVYAIRFFVITLLIS